MYVCGISLCLSLFNLALGETFEEKDEKLNETCRDLLPDCNCYDLDTLGQVRCWNATDLFTTNYLLNGSIFSINETYEIIIEGGIKILPPKSLEGLIVFRLILDNPDIQDVHEDAFQDVLRLRRFHVRCSSIKKVPNFRPIRDSFRNLNLDNSLLTSLEGDSLKDLPLLEYISFFNNSIQEINPDVFQGTSGVMVFDLSYNKLLYLPPHLFDSWTKLKKVALSHNQLLHVNGLFQLARPMFIFLDYNNLTDLDTILPATTLNLTTILVSNNPIQQVTVNSFNSKAPNLKFVYMDHCLIRSFDVNHYQNMSHLNTLDLSYNKIEIMPPQSINFGFSLELVLVGNRIREFLGEMSYNVKRLYLDNNTLQNLDKTLQFTQLTEVSVAKNKLKQLRVEDFVGVNGLNVFKVQQNRISWIDRQAFDTIRNDLNNLDLSDNLLSSLNGSVRFLSQLKYLNLTSNLITVFEEGEFVGLNELSELYIRENRIAVLGGQLQQLPQLQFLVLSSNRIQTLSIDQIPKHLQYLYLQDNPIQCDCKLIPFLQWLNSSGSPTTDHPLCLSSQSRSPSPAQSCPSGCNCYCTSDVDTFFMTLDCSFNNISVLPQLLTATSSMDQNRFDLKINLPMRFFDDDSTVDETVEIVDTIKGINLSNNILNSLENAQFPNNLRHLFLHNNNLKKMPHSILTDFSVLRKVSLSGNPWSCDCDTVDFRRCILSREEIILDGNQTLCGKSDAAREDSLAGKAIWTLDDRDLCPVFIGLYFFIAFGLIAFFLLVTVLKIAHTKYEVHIKIWLYAHGVTWVKERDLNRDKNFDAFVSFSNKDEDLVINNIISGIKANQPETKLLLHYKHFMPGLTIYENICNAIQESKRTVIVLSKNFLESEWCVFEFRTAHYTALKDKINRLIIIKLGELPDDIHPDIKVYLESTNYLTWGEKYFWEKFLYVLPTSNHLQNKTSLIVDINDFKNSSSNLL